MSNWFYHPLGDFSQQIDVSSAYWKTYSGHGAGNLDMGQGGVNTNTKVYSMCDGTIGMIDREGTFDSSGNTYCCIRCPAENNALGRDFIIRYLHGDYLEDLQVGDVVKRGQHIGYINTHGNSTGPHLHIDFSNNLEVIGRRDPPVTGTKIVRNNNIYWKDNVTGKEFLVNDSVNWDLIRQWQYMDGSSDSNIGYCWLVIAQEPQKKEKTAGTTAEVTDALVETLKNKIADYQGSYPFNAAKAILNCYNALLNTQQLNRGASIALAANAACENLCRCAGTSTNYWSHPDYTDWGFGTDGINSGIDCGIWAFHDPNNGSAFDKIVVPRIKPYVLSKGFSEDDFTKGDYAVQAQYIAGMMTNDEGAPSDRVWANSYDGKSIVSPKTGQTICATVELQQKYAKNFNQYFEDGNDIGQGALLFERIFERSNQSNLSDRAAIAYALDETV